VGTHTHTVDRALRTHIYVAGMTLPNLRAGDFPSAIAAFHKAFYLLVFFIVPVFLSVNPPSGLSPQHFEIF